MPSGPFNIGKDVTLDVVTSQGILPLPVTVTSFEAKPQYNKIRSVAIDGINRGTNVPTGWEGSIMLDRNSGVVDDFFAGQESAYFSNINSSLSASITETITESDGSISQYRYLGVVLSFDESGKYAGDQKVSQTIGFFASQKIKVQ